MRSRISTRGDRLVLVTLEAGPWVMKYVISLLLVAVIASSAASIALAQSVVEDSPAPAVASGYDLYLQQYCGLCHTLGRAGTAGIFGPPHDSLAATARGRLMDPSYRGTATTAEEYVRESILKPDVFLVPGFENSVHRMPAYEHLSPEEVDAIVAFLLGGNENHP